MMPFIDPKFIDPAVTPFGNCPTCQALIRLKVENNVVSIDERNCPNCKIQISEEEILESFIKNFLLTQAVSSANSILGFDLAVPVFLIVAVFSVLTEDSPTLSTYFFVISFLLPLFICLRWLLRFGKYHIPDEEFIDAKRKVKLSSMLWIAAHTLNVILWIYNLYNK